MPDHLWTANSTSSLFWNVVNECQIVSLFVAKSVSPLNATFSSYSWCAELTSADTNHHHHHGCPFDHFWMVCTILQNVTLSSHHCCTLLSVGSIDTSLPQKNHIRVWALWDWVPNVIAVAHQLILWIASACCTIQYMVPYYKCCLLLKYKMLHKHKRYRLCNHAYGIWLIDVQE